MLKTEVCLEAVTPVFLRGANQGRNATPELRAPSFRGVFRYWFRAMAGAAIGDSNIPLLKELESAVFGNTEAGSSIRLRIIQYPGHENYTMANILPHKPTERERAPRKTFSAGQKINLVISAPGLGKDSWIWETAIASINLALTFGGVGLRSRRGYGTLRIVQDTGGFFTSFPESSEGWQMHVEKVITGAITAFQLLSKPGNSFGKTIPLLASPIPGPAAYPCLNKLSHIRLTQPVANDCVGAVSHFMSKSYRAAYFGNHDPRQASPLWVRVVKTGNEFSLLMITLPSVFADSRHDYGKLDHFMNSKFAGTDIHVKGLN